MDTELGLAPLGFLELKPPDLITAAAAAGFSSVGIRARAVTPGGIEYPLLPGSPMERETRSRLASTGLSIFQLEIVSLKRDLDVSACRPLFETAASLGASRLVVSGDDSDFQVMVERLAQLCELAYEYRVLIDVEFMPYRPLNSLLSALRLVESAGQQNAFVMLDALHLQRSGGKVTEVQAAPEGAIGVFQICDAPLAPPASNLLIQEAREGRRLPGEGELPLAQLLSVIAPNVHLAAEVPLGLEHSHISAIDRLKAISASTRRLIQKHEAGRGAKI